MQWFNNAFTTTASASRTSNVGWLSSKNNKRILWLSRCYRRTFEWTSHKPDTRSSYYLRDVTEQSNSLKFLRRAVWCLLSIVETRSETELLGLSNFVKSCSATNIARRELIASLDLSVIFSFEEFYFSFFRFIVIGHYFQDF